MSGKIKATKRAQLAQKIKKIAVAGMSASLSISWIGGNTALANGQMSLVHAQFQPTHNISPLAHNISPLVHIGTGAQANWSNPAHNISNHLAFQQTAPFAPVFSPIAASTHLMPSGLALDLQSNAANITLGSSLFHGAAAATVSIGGVKQAFQPGQRVTAGEYLAIREVLAGGGQTLQLNADGTASGGSFSLNGLGQKLSELVIPTGVIAIDNVSSRATIKVAGDILNYGSLIGTAPGGLNLKAGDGLSNSGTISADGNLKIFVGSGNIVNSGNIQSTGGNVQIAAPQNVDIRVDGLGGSIAALHGAINIRESNYAGSANIKLSGGDYLSQNLNINAGAGTIEGNVGNVKGQVNSHAAVEHLYTNAKQLILGKNTVDGDPLFVNNGNIVINGVNTFSEDVTIIANGDVTATGGASIVDHGRNVIILAGVDTGVAGPQSGTVQDASIAATTGATVDFTAANNNGGNIDFSSGATSTVIDTTGLNAKGGDVTLAAYANGAAGGNVFFASNSTINTSTGPASASHANGGNLTIIAGAAPTAAATTVQLGSVNTAASFDNGSMLVGTGGTISIITAQPTSASGKTLTFNPDGTLANSGALVAGQINANAQVNAAGTLQTALATSAKTNGTNGGAILVHAGSTIILSNIQTNGNNGSTYAASQSLPVGTKGGNGGNITITSDQGGITTGTITASGGNGGNGSYIALNGGDGGSGATIKLTAADQVTTGSINTAGGNGGSGGDGSGTNFTTKGGNAGTGGAGGAVFIATAGTVVTAGLTLTGGSGGTGGQGQWASGDDGVNPVGGTGGGGGGGGALTINSGSLIVNQAIVSNGGAGGKGGLGSADFQNGDNTYDAGATGGTGGIGGNAGIVSLIAAQTSSVKDISALGGAGGSGGSGGASLSNSNMPGGKGGPGRQGGNGALISVQAATANSVFALTALGGAASAGGAGGNGFTNGSTGSSGSKGIASDIKLIGDIATHSTLSGTNVSLTSPAGSNGSITVGGSIFASQAVVLQADGSGSVSQNSGSITGSVISVDSPGSKDISLNLTNATSLTISSGASVTVTNSGFLFFEGASSSGPAGNFTVNCDFGVDTDSSIRAGGQVANNGGQVAVLSGASIKGDSISLTGNGIVNDGLLEATGTKGISIVSKADAGLDIQGPGMMQADMGNITLTAALSSPTSSSSSEIYFLNDQTFSGPTIFNALGANQSVVISDGSHVVGNDSLTINGSRLTLQGSGTIVGQPIIFNSAAGGGTIAATGTLDISTLGPLVFHGQNLVILAGGNITDQGVGSTIDLSNISGQGGSLSIVAGATFTPGVGQVTYPPLDTKSSYTITGFASGSIELSQTNILLSGTTYSGLLTVVAAGDVRLGSVTSQAPNINPSGILGVSAGAPPSITYAPDLINVIGQNVSFTGKIDTNNTVSITSAMPTVVGTVIAGGGLINGGHFSAAAPGGSISLQGISGTAPTISLTALADSANIISSGAIAGGVLTINHGSGNIGSSSAPLAVNTSSINVKSNGSAFLYSDASTINLTTAIIANHLSFSTSTKTVLSLDKGTIQANDISLVTPGGISFGTGLVTVTRDSQGNGGNFSLNTSTISLQNQIAIDVSGSGTGNGGSIQINQTSNNILYLNDYHNIASGGVIIGAGVNGLNLSAASGTQGGNGGSIAVTSSGSIAVQTSNTTNPTLNVNPLGASGNGGSIYLNGSSVSATNNSGINTSGSAVRVISAGGSGDITTTGPGVITVAGNTKAARLNSADSGGVITVGGGDIGIVTIPPPVIVINPDSPPVEVGVSLTGTTLPITTGGGVLITPVIIPPISLALSANGVGTGNGGSLTVIQTTTTKTVISGGTDAFYILSATSGKDGGNGGSIIFKTGGNLNVSPAGLNVSALGSQGNGGQLTLSAGTGNFGTLFVHGSLNVDGRGTGSGGSITLTSNSPTVFNVGNTARSNTNGVAGILSASGAGGKIDLQNMAGGITLSKSLVNVDNLILTASGSSNLAIGASLAKTSLDTLTLSTQSGNISASGTVAAKSLVIESDSGNIGSKNTALRIDAQDVELDGGAIVNVHNYASTLSTLETSSATGVFKYVSAGDIATNGVISSSTALTLQAASNHNLTLNGVVQLSALNGVGTFTVSGKGVLASADTLTSITAPEIVINRSTGDVGTINHWLAIDTSKLTISGSGSLYVANSGTNTLTFNGSASRGDVSLSSNSDIVIARPISSATNIDINSIHNSGAGLTIAAAVGGLRTQSINLSVGDGGNITESGRGSIKTKATDGSLTLSTNLGVIGEVLDVGVLTPVNLNFSSPNIAFKSTNGYVYLNSKQTAPLTVLTSSSGHSIALTSGGPITLSNLNADNGDITIANKSGALTVALGALVQAEGTVTLNSVNTRNGSIIVGGGSQILAGKVGDNAIGDVHLTIGSTIHAVAGTAPANLTVTGDASSAFFNKGITVNPGGATIDLVGGKIIFDAGNRPTSAISLGAGSLIRATADLIDSWSSQTELLTREIPAAVWKNEKESTITTASMLLDLRNESINSQEEKLALSQGTVIFAPQKDTTVKSPYGLVSVAAHSIVMVMAINGGLAVYNLHDTKSSAVAVAAAGQNFKLLPGKMVMLTPRTRASFAELNPAQLIGYCNVQERNIGLHEGANLKAVTAGFSLPHTLNAVIPLKQMMLSRRASDNATKTTLLKTAAILTQHYGVEYQLVIRPQMTAMLP